MTDMLSAWPSARRTEIATPTISQAWITCKSIPQRMVMSICRSRIIVIVLLFPFYWMALTAIKPNEQLVDLDHQPLLDGEAHAVSISRSCCSKPTICTGCGTPCSSPSLRRSCLSSPAFWRPMPSCACATGARNDRRPHLPCLSRASVDPVYSAARWSCQYGLFDTPFALILTYPTILIPFSTWLLMGYFKTIPFELEECALIDGASRWQILTKIILPLSVPGLISAFIFCFTLCWNEFIYALTFI